MKFILNLEFLAMSATIFSGCSFMFAYYHMNKAYDYMRKAYEHKSQEADSWLKLAEELDALNYRQLQKITDLKKQLKEQEGRA